MFSPEAMQRLSAVVLERDERNALRGLGRLGAMHLVCEKAGPETAPLEPPDRTPELARADELIARLDRLRRRLQIEQLPEPAEATEEASLDQVEERAADLEAHAEKVLKRRDALHQRWAQVTAFLDQVSAYGALELPVDRLGQMTFLHFAIGGLPPDRLEDLEDKVGSNVVLLPLAEEGDRKRLVAITSRKGRFALETALEEVGFRREALTAPTDETTAKVADEARREQARLAREMARHGEALETLRTETAQPLADLRRVAEVERQILEAEQNFPRTETTALITGWVPTADVPAVARRIRELTGGRCVIETADPGDVPEEEIPILVRHRRLLRPFQLLVAGYGLPGYRELEPTLFVAITFLAMFGMMFGDVGHGGVLVLGGLLTLWAGRSDRVRDVGLLLALGGASSVAFGFLYGEYFGISGPGLWHSPLEGNVMAFLVDAIVIGIAIISLGLVLNIINRFRRGDIVGGFLDKFGVVGAVFYWGVLALGLKFIVYHERELHWLEVTLLVIVPLAALFLKEPIQYALSRRAGREPRSKNLPLAFLESAIDLFEAVLSYTANTISFVRLAAYAISHAAILMATFLMAREVSKAAGALGGAIGIMIIILGNAAAIVLEGIIASVQALRLEYYEFFSKFFTASGRAFKPFRFAAKGQDSLPQE